LNKPHAVVIGAGIGGLVAALDLAGRGLPVSVFERWQRPGGKLRAVEIDGQHIDSGPTVFTMPWVFEEVFTAAGSSIGHHLRLQPADRLARHAWRDGSQLDLFADINRSTEAIAAFSSRSEAERYRAFCARAHKVYRTLERPFMRSQRPGMTSLIKASGVRGLLDLWRIRPFESLWRALGKSFRDPRLRGLFARYATYCGSSPLQAPATLMLIAHVEQAGVWQIDGGMRRLADALADLLENLGGKIHYDTPVSEIDVKHGRVRGIRLASGEHVAADVVVANTDVAAIEGGLMGSKATLAVPRRSSPQRSLSAVTWSLLAESSGFDLAHHNVFFPEDYPQEFNDIFGQGRLPANPAVYICAQDRGQGRSRPTGLERFFLITNAPATGDREPFKTATIAPLQSAVFQLLQDCGLNLEARPEHSIVTTPADFEARFPGTGGALYGSPAHGWRSSFSRPGSRSRIPGLYLAGGSVHPGPGVPMVALSGRLAAAAVAADLGLSEKS
jgi:1-hydroxycarotenoid 3,4-desaturase